MQSGEALSTRPDYRYDNASRPAPTVAAAWFEVIATRNWTAKDELVQVGVDRRPVSAVGLPGRGPDQCRIARGFAGRRGASAAPRLKCRAGHELGVTLEGPEALEVLRVERAAGGYRPGVLAGQPEGNPGLGVGEHRRAHGGLQLVQVLVGQPEADAETAGLGQRIGEVQRQVQVILELIDVDKDGMAALRGNRRAAEGGLPELRDNQAAEQGRGLRPEQALTEVDQQHLALGEDLAQVKARPGLP